MLFPLFVSVALAQSAPVFVQADLLNLRQAPHAGATVSGVLRIGTTVDILDEDGSWLEVSVSARPDDHPIVGWVDGDFLDPVAPRGHELLARARQASAAGDHDEALRWITRARALAPDSPELQRQTDRILAATGIEQADATLDAPSEVLVAACEVDRVELLGSIDAEGRFTQHDGDPDFEVGQLSTHHWLRWQAGRSGGEPIVGSPFVRPFHTEAYNERGRSAYEAGTCMDICEETSLPILGPCETDGAIYTSSPLPPARSREAHATAARRDALDRALAASDETAPEAVQTWFGDHGAVIRGSYRSEWSSYERIVVDQGASQTSFEFNTNIYPDADLETWPEPPPLRPGVWLTSPDQSAQIGVFVTDAPHGARYHVVTMSEQGALGTTWLTQGRGC